MPRGNGMGPAGMGPMTGRGLGYCAGFPAPGYARGGGKYGGMGRGFGFRCWNQPMRAGYPRFGVYAPYGADTGPADEQAALKNQIRFYEEQLEQAKKHLSAMEEEADG